MSAQKPRRRRVMVHIPEEVAAAMEIVMKQRGILKSTDFIRQAVVFRLRTDGIELRSDVQAAPEGVS